MGWQARLHGGQGQDPPVGVGDMEDFWEEEARRAAEEAAREDHDKALQARREARRKAEHEKGVRLGWHDEDGNAPENPDDEEDEEDEPEEEIDE